MLNAFKLETIMKSKVLLQSGCKTVGATQPTNRFQTRIWYERDGTFLYRGYWMATCLRPRVLEAFVRG
jgi:hypothetical protein